MSRVGKRSGAVALLFRKILSILENVDLTILSVEALAVSVTHDAVTIRLVVLDRPPKVSSVTSSKS